MKQRAESSLTDTEFMCCHILSHAHGYFYGVYGTPTPPPFQLCSPLIVVLGFLGASLCCQLVLPLCRHSCMRSRCMRTQSPRIPKRFEGRRRPYCLNEVCWENTPTLQRLLIEGAGRGLGFAFRPELLIHKYVQALVSITGLFCFFWQGPLGSSGWSFYLNLQWKGSLFIFIWNVEVTRSNSPTSSLRMATKGSACSSGAWRWLAGTEVGSSWRVQPWRTRQVVAFLASTFHAEPLKRGWWI